MKRWVTGTVGLLSMVAMTGLVSAAGFRPAKSQPVETLTMWGISGQPTQDLIAKQVSAFETTHRNIHVQLTFYSDADLKLKVKSATVAHDLPDVFYWWGGSYIDPQLEAHEALNLTPYLNSHPQWKKQFLPGMFKNYTQHGKIYAVGNGTNYVLLFYNKALLAKAGIHDAPTTYARMLSDIKALNAHHITPFALDGKDGWPLQEWYSYFVMRDGGSDTIYKALKGKESWAAKPFVEAAKQTEELIKTNAFEPGFESYGDTAAQNLYNDQKAAMVMWGNWVVSAISAPGLKSVLDNTSFVPFPLIPGGKGTLNEAQGGANGAWVANGTTSKSTELASEELMQYLTSTPQTNQQVTIAGNIPPNDVSYNPSKEAKLFNQVVKEEKTFTKYNLFWNEILPAAASTQYIDLLQEMATGQISPTQFCQQFETYMKTNG